MAGGRERFTRGDQSQHRLSPIERLFRAHIEEGTIEQYLTDTVGRDNWEWDADAGAWAVLHPDAGGVFIDRAGRYYAAAGAEGGGRSSRYAALARMSAEVRGVRP